MRVVETILASSSLGFRYARLVSMIAIFACIHTILHSWLAHADCPALGALCMLEPGVPYTDSTSQHDFLLLKSDMLVLVR